MRKILCTIGSIISFLYYLWLGSGTRFQLSVLPFWLLLAILLLAIGFWEQIPGTARLPRALIRFGKIILCMGTAFFLFTEGLVIHGMIQKVPDRLDYIMVLGAGLNGERPSYTLELRLERALAYLLAHPDTKILVTGGQSSSEVISEAESMKNWLVEHDIDEANILIEDQSTTTAENMQFSFPLVVQDTDKRELHVGIVTNNFHVYRSLKLAERTLENLSDGQTAGQQGNEQSTGHFGSEQVICHLYGIPASFPIVSLPHYMVREFFTICVDTLLGNM